MRPPAKPYVSQRPVYLRSTKASMGKELAPRSASFAFLAGWDCGRGEEGREGGRGGPEGGGEGKEGREG